MSADEDSSDFKQFQLVSILIESLNEFDKIIESLIKSEKFQQFDVKEILISYLQIKLDEAKFLEEYEKFNQNKDSKESQKVLFNDSSEIGEATKIDLKLQKKLAEEYEEKIFNTKKYKRERFQSRIILPEVSIFKEKSTNQKLNEELRNLFDILPSIHEISDEIELNFQIEIEKIIQKYNIPRNSIEIQEQRIQSRIRELKKSQYKFMIDYIPKKSRIQNIEKENTNPSLEEELKNLKLYSPIVVDEELINLHLFEFTIVFQSFIIYLQDKKRKKIKKLLKIRKSLVKKIKQFDLKILQLHELFSRNYTSQQLFDHLKIKNHHILINEVVKNFKISSIYSITTIEEFTKSIGNYYDYYLRIKKESDDFNEIKKQLNIKTSESEFDENYSNLTNINKLKDHIKNEVLKLNEMESYNTLTDEIEEESIPWMEVSKQEEISKVSSFQLIYQFDDYVKLSNQIFQKKNGNSTIPY
jgi:hypothetical protein